MNFTSPDSHLRARKWRRCCGWLREARSSSLPFEARHPLRVFILSEGSSGSTLMATSRLELEVAGTIDLTRYTQIVFESQRNTNFVFNRSKKGSAPCGKVEKEDDGAYWKEAELAAEVILTELQNGCGK